MSLQRAMEFYLIHSPDRYLSAQLTPSIAPRVLEHTRRRRDRPNDDASAGSVLSELEKLKRTERLHSSTKRDCPGVS
jgi:hypothetical protein